MLLSIQERRNLPLATMTRFQAKLAICADRQRILERYNVNQGKFSEANSHREVAAYLEQIVDNKLPARSVNTLGFASVNSALNVAVDAVVKQASVNGDKPAMRYVGGDYDAALATLQNTEDNDFVLTADEKVACANEARQMALKYIGNRRTLYLQKLGEFRRECETKKSMEKVVNTKLRDAGAMTFFNLMPFSDKKVIPNDRILKKIGLQTLFIDDTVRLTGLNESIVVDIVKNSLINSLDGKSLENVFDEIRPTMEQGVTISQNAPNGTQQLAFPLVIQIISIGIAAIKATASLIKQIQGISQKTYEQILDPDKIRPVEKDFNGDGVPDSEQSKLTLNANLVGAGLSAVAGVAGGLLIKNKTARNAVIAVSTVATTGLTVRHFTRTKYWLVDGEQLTAKDLADRNFVKYNGEWYFAEEVARRSTGNSVADILKGGKELYDTISGIFDLIKGDSATDTNIFVGEANAVDPGDV